MMKFTCESITIPKLGNSIDENEDNKLEPGTLEIASDTLVKFAISDGATESSFSKEWSDLLVLSYKDQSFNKGALSKTINLVSESWKSKTFANNLPWYAQQKAEIGAFATFLGVTINREENKFEAVAIGDCNLFQIRNEEIVFSFPLSSIEDFGNTPNLLASNPLYQTKFDSIVKYCDELILPNDMIILATDAIALWIFKQLEIHERPWGHLSDIIKNSENKFEKWINEKRALNEIKNDDVTLLILKFE